MKLVDTHAHLDSEQFASDLTAVLERAGTAGVTAIVAVGTTLDTSRRAVQLAREHTIVRAAVGIHPNYAAQAAAEDWQAITDLAREPEVMAIGETGLDRFRNDTPFDVQRDYFERHLRLSGERRMPVIIHCREAEADVLSSLDRIVGSGPARGVMHSFTGTAATAARCLEIGLFISFAGQVTFTNRKFDVLREIARIVPADRVLLETDSPYLAPEPHRRERNEPAFVGLTAQRLAELRGIDRVELARLTSDNAHRLFGLT